MEQKPLNLNHTVYELCQQYPELKAVMAQVGFKEISNPIAMQTAGRVMTIPKGAAIKGIPMPDVIAALRAAGFQPVDSDNDCGCSHDTCQCHHHHQPAAQADADPATREGRTQLLHSFVERLTHGEPLSSVRRDFVKHFRNVDAEEIAAAEQQLINSGVKISDVQRMCDVHSALFHGTTIQENASLDGIDSQCTTLMQQAGHPLNILYSENLAIEALINRISTQLDEGVLPSAMLPTIMQLRQLTHHFGKKGDLLFTLLRDRYGIDAPFNVMWGVDDEIRDELHRLCKQPSDAPQWIQRLRDVMQREREMIYKEHNILFPLCANHFTHDEWQEIRTEIDGYSPCLIDRYPDWAQHTHSHPLYDVTPSDVTVQLASGTLTTAQLQAMLNTMPYEITFIDRDHINRYFNQQLHGEKLFKRPLMALGRKVYDCHPPMVQPMVRRLLTEFANGQRDTFEMWSEKAGHEVLIRYMAVRDQQGNYLGAMECVQVMDFARDHYQGKQ